MDETNTSTREIVPTNKEVDARVKLAELRVAWLNTVLNKFYSGEKPVDYDAVYAEVAAYDAKSE